MNMPILLKENNRILSYFPHDKKQLFFEEAKKLAMRILENWYFTGKGGGGRSKIKAAYSWGKLIVKFIRKEAGDGE
jgi:hypothetical protein